MFTSIFFQSLALILLFVIVGQIIAKAIDKKGKGDPNHGGN